MNATGLLIFQIHRGIHLIKNMLKRFLTKARYWLLRRVAGKTSVLINAEMIDGSLKLKGESYLCNCTIINNGRDTAAIIIEDE